MINPSEEVVKGKKKVLVKVIPTEVYSRVVGYYRPIQNWNKGKVEEFGRRQMIDPRMIELGD